MNVGGILSVSMEDLQEVSTNRFNLTTENGNDFVEIFPPELSNKLFTYIADTDIFECSKCSIGWQKLINNNSQWKLRCVRRGWATASSYKEVAQKWSLIKSHIPESQNYKFRTSPVFCLSQVASLRILPLCDWAIYFRQCLHLKRNWTDGIYSTHRLVDFNSIEEYSFLHNDSDCNGKLLATGTSSGKVMIWSVEGVPKFLSTISLRRRVEVESVILVSKYLIILYQIGLIKVFDTNKLSTEGSTMNPIYQLRAVGTQSLEGIEFNLNVEAIVEDEIQNIDEDDNEDDLELWIRDLFRVDLWMGNEYFGSDMMIYANEDNVVLTGILCKCFIIWDICSGSVCRKIPLKHGFQVIYQSFLSSRKLYLSTKRRDERGNENHWSYVLVYDLTALGTDDGSVICDPFEIPTETMVEETRSDSMDKRIVYTTQESALCGLVLEKSGFEILFSTQATSFVDNLTVSDSFIVYHQHDGFIVGLNWRGEPLYEIAAHTGLVKGLKIYENLLVSGGDAMQLCVWDAFTGQKLHTVHHQPCRIQQLFVDATKIVTVGREDPPVVVAYW